MRSETIAVGTELLLGETLDTHSNYIATRLPALGIGLYRMTALGDNLERLIAFMQEALSRSDLLIVTGGLGPTEDDVTREAIAATLGETPAVDDTLAAALRQWFEKRNRPMPERNLKQAWLIPSCRAIPNPRGTAPGWWAEKDGRIIVALPGPPSEMKPMWVEHIEPELRKRNAGRVIVTRTLKTVGIGEGKVDELLAEFLHASNPTVGIYSRSDGIHVRLGALADDAQRASDIIAPIEEKMRAILGKAVWGADDDTVQDAAVRLLGERSIAVIEDAVSGGSFAACLTAAAGADRIWKGGEIAGFDTADAEAAMRRAERASERADVGVGIAATPGGDCWIALKDRDGETSTFFTLPQGLSALRSRLNLTALALIRSRYL